MRFGDHETKLGNRILQIFGGSTADDTSLDVENRRQESDPEKSAREVEQWKLWVMSKFLSIVEDERSIDVLRLEDVDFEPDEREKVEGYNEVYADEPPEKCNHLYSGGYHLVFSSCLEV